MLCITVQSQPSRRCAGAPGDLSSYSETPAVATAGEAGGGVRPLASYSSVAPFAAPPTLVQLWITSARSRKPYPTSPAASGLGEGSKGDSLHVGERVVSAHHVSAVKLDLVSERLLPKNSHRSARGVVLVEWVGEAFTVERPSQRRGQAGSSRAHCSYPASRSGAGGPSRQVTSLVSGLRRQSERVGVGLGWQGEEPTIAKMGMEWSGAEPMDVVLDRLDDVKEDAVLRYSEVRRQQLLLQCFWSSSGNAEV
jgi:hypothetical protein